MPEMDFAVLTVGLPPEPTSVLSTIQERIAESGQKIVVLDDDPTGTQTVHGVSVLTEWTVPSLNEALASNDTAFYILTNSRSLPLDAAQALNREIGENLKCASTIVGQDVAVISRSDSTLRGHFPGEVDVLIAALDMKFDGIILAPYFREGGRYTIDDIHYVMNGGRALPAAETEFARDPSFGYCSSNLRDWVEEKTGGHVASAQVVSVSIADLRTGQALPKLTTLKDQQVCILNAACDADIEQAALALLEAERRGMRLLYRTAASFVRVRAGIAPRPLLAKSELIGTEKTGGLIVVGSFVPKTSTQLAALRQRFSFCELELDVPTLLDDDRRTVLLEQVRHTMQSALAAGQDVLLFTSRVLVSGVDTVETLRIGSVVSDSIVACIRGLLVRPRYLVVKGGITSSDIATRGLSVRKAQVLGQVLPGIPVWKLGPESCFPGMAFVVFPGNVGELSALADVVAILQK